MDEPIVYFLEHSNATVKLVLTNTRLTVSTQGKGLLDKSRVIDISLSDLKNFCVIPTIGAQNLVGRFEKETKEFTYDYSCDSEFIFSFHENGRVKKKRVFVNSRDEKFQIFFEFLKNKCPSASLLHLGPEEARTQIGITTARTGVYVVLGTLIGVPVILSLIIIIFKIDW